MIRDKKRNRKLGWALFLVYLALLVYFAIFAESFGRVSAERDYVYNLELFKEIMDGAEHCNNVSTLRSFADKAEALKLRLLNEMNAEDIRLAKEAAAKAEAERKRQEEEAEKRGETVKPAEKVAEPQPVYKVRTTKNVSIKTVAKTASWRLESKDDVDKYLAALRENLLKEMDEDTIVNIEL